MSLQTISAGDYDGIIFSANWFPDQLQDINELINWANRQNIEPVVMLNRVKFTDRVREFTAGAENIDIATQMRK